MDAKKVEELKKLANEFCNKFAEIVESDENGKQDASLIFSMRLVGPSDDKDHDCVSSTVATIGTLPGQLLAMHKLDEKTDIITDYATTQASMMLDDMMKRVINKAIKPDDDKGEEHKDDGEEVE